MSRWVFFKRGQVEKVGFVMLKILAAELKNKAFSRKYSFNGSMIGQGSLGLVHMSWVVGLSSVLFRPNSIPVWLLSFRPWAGFPRRIVAHKAFPDTVTTHLLSWILSSNVALVLMHRISLCDDVSMAIIDP